VTAIHRSPMLRSVLIVLVSLAFALTTTGCFNTYRFAQPEFKKLEASDKVPVTVLSKRGKKVSVNRRTNTFVRSIGGRRYPITAFNFKMTRSQLVASDRDTLLPLSELKSYEVDLLSTPITVLLISAGVAVAGGLIAFAVISAE
jgi:hypothetical protein